MSAVQRLNGFLKEVQVEARKVTWPSKTELRESTVVVIVTVAIVSVLIAVIDYVIGQIVTRILG